MGPATALQKQHAHKRQITASLQISEKYGSQMGGADLLLAQK